MKYDVLMIDPPWPKGKGGKRSVRPKQGRTFAYDTMPVDDIMSLFDKTFLPMAADTHAVFVWTIDSFLSATEALMQSRDYRRHAVFVWDKGNGVAPAFTVRYSHEYLIWYYKPKLMPVHGDARGKFTTVIREKSREHSRKPDAAYQLIESLYPWQAKIDVFSRETRPGWDQWGNQCNHFATAQKEVT